MDLDYYYYDYDDSVGDEIDYADHQQPAYMEEEHHDEHDQSLIGAFRNCVQPSVSQIGAYVLVLLGWSLLCRLIWICARRFLSNEGEWLKHLASMACGFAALYYTTGHEFLIVVFLSLMAYVLMLFLEYRNWRNIGFTVALATIGSHFLYEALWNKPETWQRLRGIQMVAAMKAISFSFDTDSLRQKENQRYSRMPALVPYLGYLFCPATCVLGPWIPYSAYLRSLRTPSVGGRWLWWSTINAAIAVAFLSLSNCIVPLLCSDEAWKWLRTYRDALAVRCSHYFICFLSQATLAAAGVTLRVDGVPNAFLGQIVTKPWLIELPRSLSSLVRIWNIPMHDWLKTYVFRAAHHRFGSYLAAIFGTYLVSSLLHGFHLKIYIVLLSLGCFAYAENILRCKLATIFGACIKANSCRKPCQFIHCPSRGWRSRSSIAVLVVNFLFGLLAVFHLAYLGVMMNVSEDTNVFSLGDGLWKWSNLDYFSHCLALFSYIFNYLI